MLILRAGVPKLRIDEVTFTPDGTGLFAPALSSGLCYWPDYPSGGKAEVLTLPARVIRRLVCAPDCRKVYAGNDQICVFDVESRKGALIDIPKWDTLAFALSPDGQRLAVAEKPKESLATRLTLWSTNNLTTPETDLTIPPVLLYPPSFMPDGGRFLMLEAEITPTNRYAYRRVLRSSLTGEILDRADPFPDDPDQMILSPDGTTVACRTRNNIRLYPVTGGSEPVSVIANESKQHFTGIAYHPSGRILAATSNDKSVKLYDATTGALSQSFEWNIGRLRSVVFSPDGMVAAAGSDTGKVVVWDVDM
jgi:tricorn protease-like protein